MVFNTIVGGDSGSGGGKVWFGAALAPSQMSGVDPTIDPTRALIFDTSGLFDGSEDVRIVTFPTCKTNNNLISFNSAQLCLGVASDLLITQSPTHLHPGYGFPVWYPSQILLDNRGTTVGNTNVSSMIESGSFLAYPNSQESSIFIFESMNSYMVRVTSQNDYFRWFAIIAQI